MDQVADVDFETPVRVPGTHPPSWIPDSDVSACQLCNAEFTLIRRRHHCRSCGKIFCSECCHLKARLPYLNNKEARVCDSCVRLLAITLARPTGLFSFNGANELAATQAQRPHNRQLDQDDQAILDSSETAPSASATAERISQQQQQPSTSTPQPGTSSSPSSSSSESTLVNYSQSLPIQGVLKTSSRSRNRIENSSLVGTSRQNQTISKQVIFSDGIRPGADLYEASYLIAGVSSGPMTGLERRHRYYVNKSGSKHRRKRSNRQRECSPLHDIKHVTLSDELGFLPPIVIEDSPKVAQAPDNSAVESGSSFSSVFGQDLVPDMDLSSQSNDKPNDDPPDNQIRSFAEVVRRTGHKDGSVKFLLLKNFYIFAKVIDESCCMRKSLAKHNDLEKSDPKLGGETSSSVANNQLNDNVTLIQKMMGSSNNSSGELWYFRSEGLAPLGQNEIVFVLDKPSNEHSLPRDVFKLYLTIHELSLRGQAFGNLGNLLFTDGLFGNKNIAGVLFTRPAQGQCFANLILPKTAFLIAILIQKWEVPWSKVFPLRLLLRLGIEYCSYPFMIASLRDRPPVYYEVGHTIIGILADLRNYRYTVESVPKMSVIIDINQEKVTIKFPKSFYQQVMKVLSNSNNEHVLSWMSDICSGVDGHLVSVQNDDGQHDTQVFTDDYELLDINKSQGRIIGASFVIFSGALKASQPGQKAKISIVEDGLLIQIHSHTLASLRNSIQSMNEFTIESGVESGKPSIIKTVSVVWIDTAEIPTSPHGVISPIDGRCLDPVKNIRVHNSADFVTERYLMRWTDVYITRNEQGLSDVDVSRLAEEVSRVFCFSLCRFLEPLFELGKDIIGLRLTINGIDEIGFEVGSQGADLPVEFVKDLDDIILPILSNASGSIILVIELTYYILRA